MKYHLVVAVAIVAIMGVWIAFEFHGSRPAGLRQFDPDEVARLDTVMWRSYYDRERLRLFSQLIELVRQQYHLPLIRSTVAAYEATRAAFVFKEGHSRADYERALPNLVTYYGMIEKANDEPFDVEKAARLELEWWIVHREKVSHPSGDLERSLAMASAELYHVPAANLMEYARLRAEAMVLRDVKAEAGGVSREDWDRIGQLLQASWRSLWKAINPHS